MNQPTQNAMDMGIPIFNPPPRKRTGFYPRFIGCLANWSWAVMILSIVFVIVFIGAIRIPPYPAFVEGNQARAALVAKRFDAWEAARDDWLDFSDMIGGPSLNNSVRSPYVDEVNRQSIQFWFQSESGDALTPQNLQTQLNILNRASKLTVKQCLKNRATGVGCEPPFHITKLLGTTNSGEVKQGLRDADNLRQDIYSRFVGADTDFATGVTEWTKGRLPIGGPLPGFANITDREDDQADIYDKEFKTAGFTGLPTADGWIRKIEEIIEEETQSNPDLQVTFANFPMISPRLFQTLLRDGLFSIGALLGVGIIMWIQVGSVFLSIMGMTQIVISFVITLSTWRLIGNESFTFIQVLVIFIILGIGADDIFVFMDAWKQSRHQDRLEWTWRRAFKAMLVTSLTTICAFCLTSIIDVPTITTFGTFAAIVVAWNFLFVITWFPACVIFHQKFIVQSCNGFCAKRVCGCCCQWCASNYQNDEAGVQHGSGADRVEDSNFSFIERFFKNTLHPFLVKPGPRIAVFVIFLAFAAIGIALAATKIELTDKAFLESFLKDDSQLQKDFNLLLGSNPAFRTTSDGLKRAGHIVWGIDRDHPIDRSGTYALGEGDQIGEPVFNEENLQSTQAQLSMVQTCDAIANLDSVATSLRTNRKEVVCFMQDFKRYREAKSMGFPVPENDLVPELMKWKADACSEPGCYANEDGTGVSQVSELYELNTGFLTNGNKLTYVFASGNLTIPFLEQELKVIEPEYDEWKKFGDDQNKDGLQTFAITDRTGWIILMRTLVNGVASGVPVALAVSLVVLILATANWITSILAVVTIVGVMASFFITFVGMGWKIGYYESMFLQITVGMSVDYVVHLAHAYNQSTRFSRVDKMQDSLTEMGVSVFSGAITTLVASGFLFATEFNVFYQYGSFIFFVILWSIAWALLAFPAMMMTFGPNGDGGNIMILKKLHHLISGNSTDEKDITRHSVGKPGEVEMRSQPALGGSTQNSSERLKPDSVTPAVVYAQNYNIPQLASTETMLPALDAGPGRRYSNQGSQQYHGSQQYSNQGSNQMAPPNRPVPPVWQPNPKLVPA